MEHIEHILRSCSEGLREGRYHWRHNQVLETIAEAISTRLESAKWCWTSKKTITFVRVGVQPSATKRPPQFGKYMAGLVTSSGS